MTWTALVAVLLAGLLSTSVAAAAESQVVGKIKTVDVATKTVVLEDGTKLMVPDDLLAQTVGLAPGSTVRVKFEDKGGQKVVTALEPQRSQRQ